MAFNYYESCDCIIYKIPINIDKHRDTLNNVFKYIISIYDCKHINDEELNNIHIEAYNFKHKI
ncbi:MAG: hypothetical protein J6A59_00535 [Lachnospiraceae bacterium]|nr:hypothetical protein [Lachnospiraceae bacterium]